MVSLVRSIISLASDFGLPANFEDCICHGEITEPQYFITLSLDSYWTYFWKHYVYNKKDTKFGNQNFGYQIWFCTRLIYMAILAYGFTRPRWVNSLWPRDAIWGHRSWYTLAVVMACCLMAPSHYLKVQSQSVYTMIKKVTHYANEAP